MSELPGDGLPVPKPQSELERVLGASARVLLSDQDRNRVAEVLGDAYAEGRLTPTEYDERLTGAMSARTLSDLVPLVEGLPPVVAATALAPLLPTEALAGATAGQQVDWYYKGGTPASSSNPVAIFGGATRKGDWVVPETMTAAAVFGGVELDLRDARFTAQHTTITANAVFGGVEITVPEDVTLVVDGTGIFGGFDGSNQGEGDPGAPVLRVTGVAFFGGVDVKRKSRRRRSIGGGGGSGRPELPR